MPRSKANPRADGAPPGGLPAQLHAQRDPEAGDNDQAGAADNAHAGDFDGSAPPGFCCSPGWWRWSRPADSAWIRWAVGLGKRAGERAEAAERELVDVAGAGA